LAAYANSEFILKRFEEGFRRLWLFERLKNWRTDTYLAISNYLTL